MQALTTVHLLKGEPAPPTAVAVQQQGPRHLPALEQEGREQAIALSNMSTVGLKRKAFFFCLCSQATNLCDLGFCTQV